MSNEQNGPGIDPLVSDTYREMAEERTPEALDREVLRMAASELRTRYAIARAWTRPLAWAATIGLSLVLVLQLADVPQPVAGSPEAPEHTPASLDQDPDDALEVAAPEKRSRTEMQQQDHKAGVMKDTPAAAPRAAEEDAMAEEEPPAQNYLSRDAMQGAREKARIQEGFRQEPKEEVVNGRHLTGEQAATAERPAARSVPGFAATAAADDSGFLCPESARETAEDWLECIVALEETAPPELVDREYRAIHERFPELGEVSR